MLLSSCANQIFVNAYDFRNQAASDVGLQDGSPTVWNQDVPLQLGRIYQLYGNPRNGYDLPSYSGLFTSAIADKSVSTTGPDHSSWSADISDSNKVDLQLGYMGLQAVADTNSVKKISFSLEGDTKGTVMEYDKLQTILNDPNNGPTLRASILDDTQRVFDQKLSRQTARFWIVLQVHAAKNLTVTLQTDSSFTAKLDTSDAAKLASWIAVPNLAFPTVSVAPDHQKDITFKDTDSFGWVAMCVPLFAYASGPSKGQIYPDETTVLWAANTLHH